MLEPFYQVKCYTVGDRISNIKHMKGMSKWGGIGNGVLRWLTRIAAGNFNISDLKMDILYHTADIIQVRLESIYPRYGYCNDILVNFQLQG